MLESQLRRYTLSDGRLPHSEIRNARVCMDTSYFLIYHSPVNRITYKKTTEIFVLILLADWSLNLY